MRTLRFSDPTSAHATADFSAVRGLLVVGVSMTGDTGVRHRDGLSRRARSRQPSNFLLSPLGESREAEFQLVSNKLTSFVGGSTRLQSLAWKFQC